MATETVILLMLLVGILCAMPGIVSLMRAQELRYKQSTLDEKIAKIDAENTMLRTRVETLKETIVKLEAKNAMLESTLSNYSHYYRLPELPGAKRGEMNI